MIILIRVAILLFAKVRRIYLLSSLIILYSTIPVSGITPTDSAISGDSNLKHALVITPSFGYGELPFLEGPMAGAIYYNDEYHKTGSALINCSVDYLLTPFLNIEAAVSYQPAPFSSMVIEQYYYYQYASNPYSFNIAPAIQLAADYYKSDNASVGLAASYQSIRCSSQNVQPFYPGSVLFQEYSLGVRSIYYFEGRYSKNLQFYLGGRLDICVWNETDNWNNGSNSQYIPVIVSSTDGLILPNNSQFSMTFIGGARYFFTPHIGAQLEAGFGFGSPYYSQFGFVIMLNNRNLKQPHNN